MAGLKYLFGVFAMGESTAISWAHHTFNPWWGCQKISPGCENCYAQRDASRYHAHDKLWDPALKNRHVMAESTWKKLKTYDNKARKAGEIHRVFVGSMCDIADEFGPHDDRKRMFEAPALYPNLIFMFLTKRVARFLEYAEMFWPDGVPENVWFGWSAEDQPRFDERWAEIEARVEIVPQFAKIFMSYGPAIGLIEMTPEAVPDWLDLVIAEGESGPLARPADPEWFRSMRDQCQDLGIDFHFKQHGEYYPVGRPENVVGHESFTKYDGKHISLGVVRITYFDNMNDILQYRRMSAGGEVLERVGLDRLRRDGVHNKLDGIIHSGGLG